MKRIFSFVLACITALSIGACGQSVGSSSEAQPEASGESVPAAPESEAGSAASEAAPVAANAPVAPAGFPSKEITLIVPLNAGGGTDLMCRKLSEIIQTEYGVNIVVSNVPGSGGVVGLNQTLTSAADGYTIGLIGATGVSTMIRGELGFTADDMTFLIPLYGMNHVIIVNSGSEYDTPQKLIEAAQASPGTITVGHNGTFNTAQAGLIALGKAYGDPNLFKSMPFDGASRAMTELMGGHIDAMIVGIGDALTQINSGELVPILGLTFDRIKGFEQIPTVTDLGLSEDSFENVTYVRWLICGPGGMDDEVEAYVSALFAGAMQTPEFQQYAAAGAYDVDTTTGVDMRVLFDDYYKIVETWNKYFS